MRINVVSTWNMYPAFMDAFTGLLDQDFAHLKVGGVRRHNAWPGEASGIRRILQLGPLPKWAEHTPVPRHIELIEGPSARQVTHTAGGVTKLERALVRYLAEEHELVLPDGPPYTVVGTFGWMDRERWAGWLAKPGALVVDIEVSGDIRVDEPEDTELLSVAVLFADEPDRPIFVWHKAALRNEKMSEILRRLLYGASDLIAHNGKFDFRWISNHFGEQLYCTEDSMIAHSIQFPGHSGEHGLKDLAFQFFNAPDWDAVLKDYTQGKAHYERIPQHILCKYNAEDVYWTYHLWKHLKETLPEDQQELYRFVMQLSQLFQDVEAAGMPVDADYLNQLLEHFTPIVEGLLQEVEGLVEPGFNPNSPPQIKKFLASEGMVTGSTDADALRGLARMVPADSRLGLFFAKLSQLRKVNKLNGTYVKAPLKKIAKDGRVHSTFHVHVTKTGRTSSSNPNVQNVPRDEDQGRGIPSTRRVYAEKPGFVIVGADYSQAELRVMAEEANDEKMIYDLRDGGPDYFNNLLPSVYADVDFGALEKSYIKEYFRNPLKQVVYGMAYGRRAAAIAHQLTEQGVPTTVEFAQAIIDNYLENYADLARWRQWVLHTALNGELRTIFGRRFQQDYVPESLQHSIGNSALSFIPQSSASDVCLHAALRLRKVLLPGVRIIATVHDAIYLSSPEGDAAERTLEMTQDIMRTTATDFYKRVPFLTEGKISRYWNEC